MFEYTGKSYMEQSRLWNIELDCIRGCDHIYVASMGMLDD